MDGVEVETAPAAETTADTKVEEINKEAVAVVADAPVKAEPKQTETAAPADFSDSSKFYSPLVKSIAKTEGIICAPETSHAIAAAIQEANKAKEEGKEKVIIFNLSGPENLTICI